MIPGILLAIAWFGLFFLAHVTAFRLRPGIARSKFVIRSFLASMIGMLASVYALGAAYPGAMTALGANPVLSGLAGALCMLCLFVLYMPFYYTLNTSLSVETLALLLAHGKGHLPADAVEHRFTSRAFVMHRLATMETNGYFVCNAPGEWRLTARGRRIATVMRRVKDALMLGSGG